MIASDVNILIVDDHEPVGAVIAFALEAADYYAEAVKDGAAAWDRIRSDPSFFQLIITDHHLPGLSGTELVRRLRAAKFPGRIIVHSGHLRPLDVQLYERLAVDRIVRKPADLVVLIGVIEQLTRH